jgi:hypothetical protein
VIDMTVPQPIVRLDAIAKPRGNRRDDSLHDSELLVFELRPVLVVLAGDPASSHRFGQSRRRRQAGECVDAAQYRLGAFGKFLIPDLEVAGWPQGPGVGQEPLDRSHPVLRRHGFRLRPIGRERSRGSVVAPPEREVGPPVDGEERRHDGARIADHVQKQGIREDRAQVSSHQVSYPLSVFGVHVCGGERGIAEPRIDRAAPIPQGAPLHRPGREPVTRATDRPDAPEARKSLELGEGRPAIGVVREPGEVRVLAEELLDDRRPGSPAADDEKRPSRAVSVHGSTAGLGVC